MKTKLTLLALLLAMNPMVDAAQWDYPEERVTLNSVEQVQQFVQQHYADQGEFKLRYQTTSLLGHHYNFDVWQHGQYQQQKSLVVTTDQQHRVARVFRSLENTVLINGEPTTAVELEHPRRLEADFPPALEQGELETVEIQVFDPDLRTQQQLPAPSSGWNSMDDYPGAMEYQRRNISLLKTGQGYFLRNRNVVEVDAKALISVETQDGVPVRDESGFAAPTGISHFAALTDLQTLDSNDPRFLAVMAFYHLDHSLEYTKTLGYALFNEPLKFDGRGLSANNSTYYKGPQAAMFGLGGVSPDAMDADVILHELGHGIHYQIVPDWAYGHSGAIGEGFGDYWAGSHSYRQQYLDAARRGQEFELDTVFNWDGVFGNRLSTRSLWNQRARYFEHGHYRAHESVGGELGDELWSTPLFQALKESVTLLGDGDERVFRQFDTIVLQGMYGLGRGVKMHDLAESTVLAAATLYPEKPYAEILQRHFKRHGLLKAPFTSRLESKYITDAKPLSIELVANGRAAEVEARLSLQQQILVEKQSQLTHSLTLSSELPEGLVCGQPFVAQVETDYRHQPWLAKQQWQESITLVRGVPQLVNSAQQMDARLNDAGTDAQGRFNVGQQIFSQTFLDRDVTIGEQFAIYLDIDHASMADLSITLTSPKGDKLVLWNHQISQGNGFKGYFTVAHDAQLAPLLGQQAWGRWRLEIMDSIEGNQGRLNAWGISQFEQYQCNETRADSTSKKSGGQLNLFVLWALFSIFVARAFCSRQNLS
ncbi:proprotein convertase P-domain-containing protein [Vibrio vulnificus]|nr:propeptide, peptidase [Vibrio vulnificus]MCU8307153.1 proprotein convertase P-domain-containing protein [Vibrio vulnificus]